MTDTWAGSRDSRADVASWNKSLLNENNEEKRIVIRTRRRFMSKTLYNIYGVYLLKKWITLLDRRCRRRYAALCLMSQKEHTGTCDRSDSLYKVRTFDVKP